MKTSLEAIRRRDLIEAAYQTFLEFGLKGMTAARIGKRAGLSHGMINYYFKSKDELLTAVVRHANRTIMDETRRRLRDGGGPKERLLAVLESHFPEESFNSATANAWLSFYAAVPDNKDFVRIHNVYYKRLHSNLVYNLRQLVSEKEAHIIAVELSTLIDGLWMRCGIEASGTSRQQAIDLILHYLNNCLGRADGARLQDAGPAQHRFG